MLARTRGVLPYLSLLAAVACGPSEPMGAFWRAETTTGADVPEDAPQTPSRHAVGGALRVAAPAVKERCPGEGVARTRIGFVSSGRVQRIEVTEVPRTLAECVVGVLRDISLPPFRAETFNVIFPFRLQPVGTPPEP